MKVDNNLIFDLELAIQLKEDGDKNGFVWVHTDPDACPTFYDGCNCLHTLLYRVIDNSIRAI